jgi:hypothetical protein
MRLTGGAHLSGRKMNQKSVALCLDGIRTQDQLDPCKGTDQLRYDSVWYIDGFYRF